MSGNAELVCYTEIKIDISTQTVYSVESTWCKVTAIKGYYILFCSKVIFNFTNELFLWFCNPLTLLGLRIPSDTANVSVSPNILFIIFLLFYQITRIRWWVCTPARLIRVYFFAAVRGKGAWDILLKYWKLESMTLWTTGVNSDAF